MQKQGTPNEIRKTLLIFRHKYGNLKHQQAIHALTQANITVPADRTLKRYSQEVRNHFIEESRKSLTHMIQLLEDKSFDKKQNCITAEQIRKFKEHANKIKLHNVSYTKFKDEYNRFGVKNFENFSKVLSIKTIQKYFGEFFDKCLKKQASKQKESQEEQQQQPNFEEDGQISFHIESSLHCPEISDVQEESKFQTIQEEEEEEQQEESEDTYKEEEENKIEISSMQFDSFQNEGQFSQEFHETCAIKQEQQQQQDDDLFTQPSYQELDIENYGNYEEDRSLEHIIPLEPSNFVNENDEFFHNTIKEEFSNFLE